MAGARLTGAVRLPYHLLDAVADMHAALEPESGHLICHYHELGAGVVEAGGVSVPVLLVGSCMGVTAGRRYVEALVSAARPSPEAVSEALRSPEAVGYVSLALEAIRSMNATAEAYRLPMEEGEAVLLVGRNRGEEAAFIILLPCRRESGKAEKNKPGIFV